MNKTKTLPSVGPFRPHPKAKPQRCINRHVAVKCGEKPGARRVVLAPAETFDGGWLESAFNRATALVGAGDPRTFAARSDMGR